MGNIIEDFGGLIDKLEMIDLSHRLEDGIPKFPTHTSFRHVPCINDLDPATMFSLEIHEHTGTHVDAPDHFLADKKIFNSEIHTVDVLPLRKFIGPAVVVTISPNEENLVTKQMLIDWERQNLNISSVRFVMFNFGWAAKWKLGDSGLEFTRDYPGISRDCAQYISDNGVLGVGTDCIGLDAFESVDIPAHDVLLQKGIYIFENLANLSSLDGVFIFQGFPLRIRGGSGSPIRASAYTNRKEA
jgi:kynurenine formamidase